MSLPSFAVTLTTINENGDYRAGLCHLRWRIIMCWKLIYLFSFIFVLALAGNTFSADDPSLVLYYSFDDVFHDKSASLKNPVE